MWGARGRCSVRNQRARRRLAIPRIDTTLLTGRLYAREKMSASTPTIESGFAKVGDARLFYTSYGVPEKGTLLGLHGGPGLSHRYLLSLFDLAPLGFKVVLYDQLGCGSSSRPRTETAYDFRRAAEEVEGVRRALRLRRVHLFGHSYGGILALEAVARFPRSFRSVTFASAPIGGTAASEREGKRFVSQLPPKARRFWTRPKPDLEDIWDTAREGGFRKFVEGYELIWRRHVCRLRNTPYEVVQSMQGGNPKVARGIWTSLRNWSGRNQEYDSAKVLPRVRIPCLVTVGRYDQIPVGVARATHKQVRESQFAIFEKSAHVPHWEERDRYIDALRHFLERARPRG